MQGRAGTNVVVWRVSQAEAEAEAEAQAKEKGEGKWRLLRNNVVHYHEYDDYRPSAATPMPSMADLIAKGLDLGSEGKCSSLERVDAAGKMPLITHEIAHRQIDCSEKFVTEEINRKEEFLCDDKVSSINASPHQARISAGASQQNTIRKPGRKRVTFRPEVKRLHPSHNTCHKNSQSSTEGSGEHNGSVVMVPTYVDQGQKGAQQFPASEYRNMLYNLPNLGTLSEAHKKVAPLSGMSSPAFPFKDLATEADDAIVTGSEPVEVCEPQQPERNTHIIPLSAASLDLFGTECEVSTLERQQPEIAFPRKGACSMSLFQTASGKPVRLSLSSIKKAETIFKEEFISPSFSDKPINGKVLPPDALGSQGMQLSWSVNGPATDPRASKLAVYNVRDDLFNACTETRTIETFPSQEYIFSEKLREESGPQCLAVCSPTAMATIANPRETDDRNAILSGKTQDFVHQNSETASIFSTASGKPVKISASALSKAYSIFDDNGKHKKDTGLATSATENDNDEDLGFSIFPAAASSPTAASCTLDNNSTDNMYAMDVKLSFADRNTSSGSLFRTATGRPVTFSASALQKAYSLLGNDNPLDFIKNGYTSGRGKINDQSTGAGIKAGDDAIQRFYRSSASCLPSLVNSIYGNTLGEAGIPFGMVVDGNRAKSSMFQTGRGKPVAISSSSLKKARSMLGDDGNENFINERVSGNIFETEGNLNLATSPMAISKAETFSCRSRMEKSAMGTINNLNCKNEGEWHSKVGDEHQIGDTSSLSGGTFNVSCRAMKRAKVLLGINTNDDVMNLSSVPDAQINQGIVNTSPLLFQTGRGKPICISSDAIKRARNILKDIDNTSEQAIVSKVHDGTCESLEVETISEELSNKENLPFAQHYILAKTSVGESGTPPKDIGANILGKRKNSMSPLVDISNASSVLSSAPQSQKISKRTKTHRSYLDSKVGHAIPKSVTPFKQPRRSIFVSPFGKTKICVDSDSKAQVHASAIRTSEKRFHFCFPSANRKTLQEFFYIPPQYQQMPQLLSSEIQSMTADNAQNYKFCKECISSGQALGAQDFQQLLLRCGADQKFVTKDWVENHYKWIVWKLASIERSYAREAGGKYLTVKNVLEQLKYRYEREVNLGHRSPLKRIVEGDAASGQMMVLCVSAIRSKPKNIPCALYKSEKDEDFMKSDSNDLNLESEGHLAKIEITDGWYRLNSILDECLSSQLVSGKIFVGQKLRLCGASLLGWGGPLTPLEAFHSVKLMLHINGTYRAHWADRLSFCRGIPKPLAFSCIKEGGGTVPRTLLVVTRIYPTLYMERQSQGGKIIRSARGEDKSVISYNERRADIVQHILSKAENENFCSLMDSTTDNDEGAELYNLLENAAEPELLMADMTSVQLAAFTTYSSKREAARQATIEKHIQKALKDANLDSRQVTSFRRIRVSGLTGKSTAMTAKRNEMSMFSKRDGLITIWYSSNNEVLNLEEGALYSVSGLVPYSKKSNDGNMNSVIWFHANKGTQWRRLPQSACEMFEYVYSPRNAFLLSDMEKIPLNSEFDCAAFVLHIEEPRSHAFRTRQWLFLSDGSVEESCSKYERILAIDYSLPHDAFIPFDSTLVGSTVGFCNLVRKSQDQSRGLWVAEMTENSEHSLNFSTQNFSHLKLVAESVNSWAKEFIETVKLLSCRVLTIIKQDI